MEHNRVSISEVTKVLEKKVLDIFDSEEYQTCLKVMSKFHKYSVNNCILILLQKPEATYVAGYKAWQTKFKRHVKVGERGIRVLAPILVDDNSADSTASRTEGQQDGVKKRCVAFRQSIVFDISQTEGEDLPVFMCNELFGQVNDYAAMLEAVKEISPFYVLFGQVRGTAKGFTDGSKKRILIKDGMSEVQTLKTLVHEVAHSMLHCNLDADAAKDRGTIEVEAESIAFIVCNNFGIDTSEYSFKYIAEWSNSRELKELKSSLNIIKKTASDFIMKIEETLKKKKN